MRPVEVGEIVGGEAAQRKDLPERTAAEEHDQEHGEQEIRDRVAEDDDRRGRGVEARAVLDRLADAERNRDGVGDERHPHAERDRDRQFLLDQREDGRVAVVALAEMEGRVVAHQNPEPLPRRLVEAILLLQFLDELRIEPLRAAIARGDVAPHLPTRPRRFDRARRPIRRSNSGPRPATARSRARPGRRGRTERWRRRPP